MVDAVESSIESRQAAKQAFQKLGAGTLKGLLIYVPAKAPLTDEQKQSDPFSLYAECGDQFPNPEADSDEYQNLCLKAKPEYNTELRQIFKDDPSPAFAVIDAVGGGLNFPQLRATLKAESSIDILTALLAPTDAQQQALKASDRWATEVKEFLKTTISLSLKTRAKTWSPIADELWRFVLFSEFVFDLPTPLPDALQGVPHASNQADITINEVCDRLRNDQRLQSQYIDRAEAIEAEMNLLATCREIDDLGNRDTFPFEERTSLKQAINGLLQDDLDIPRQLLSKHEHSIWRGKGENQEQWLLLQAALSLISVCEDFDRQLPDHSRSQDTLIDFYISSLREVDRRQREFEESVGNATTSRDLLDPVITAARNRYRRLIEKVQTLFTRHLEKGNWPPTGRLTNAGVFDRFVSPRLGEKGYRVAYLMIDALRYELGVELEKLLTDVGVEMHSACAQLPTITPVGMASLLPGAQDDLTLEYEKETLVPKLNGTVVANVGQRMDILRKRFGDRFAEMLLKDFINSSNKKPKVESTVDLLVLRSTEIDNQLESDPENTLSLIPKTLKLIRAALTKLSELGFREAIVVSDHGFFLNAQAEAGDVCRKPEGNWLYNAHDRLLLGNGAEDNHSLLLGTDKLGIRGSFTQAALPRTMAPYKAGHLYFHGGVSLADFNSQRIAISQEFYRDNDRILEGGIWADLMIAHNDIEEDDYAFYLEELRPIQLSRFNFDRYTEGSQEFTRDEWLEVILRTVGLEPAKLTERQRLHYIARLAPLVEPNFNFIELGPRGTGKSYFFSEFSPYSTLISGGQATKATLFYNNARGRVGLVGFWDTVAFDEVGGIKIKDTDTVQIMKDFMANGRFSRGVEVIADASLAFVGNIDMSVEQIVNSSQYDLFQPLPAEFDLAVMDRFACYLPGWEMPKNSSEFLTNSYGFITDYLAEAFHHLFQHTNRYEEVTRRIRLGSAVEGRDEKGIKKMVAAFLKILHPAGSPTDQQFGQYVAYAVECRRRIEEQMNKRKPDDEFARINLSYIAENGREIIVFCPESKEAAATQSPRRRALDEEAKPKRSKTGKNTQKPTGTPLPVSQAAIEPSPLQEQHFTIHYGATGYSYDSMIAPYSRAQRP